MFVGLGTFYAVRYIYDEQCLLHLVIYVQQPNAIINQLYQLYTPLNYHCPVCLGTKNPPCPLPAVWPGPGTMCPASGGVTWRGRTSRPWFGLAGLNDVPNISKPWDFLKPWDGTFLNSIVFGENMAWIWIFFGNLWLYFFHLVAVNQAGLSVNHPHVITGQTYIEKDLQRVLIKQILSGPINTWMIRPWQIFHTAMCCFLQKPKPMLQISYHFWLLLRPVSVRTFEVGHVTSVCAGFMADPPSVRCGSVASLDTLRPRPFLLRGVSQASRDLGLQSVAGSAAHVCRWPRFSIDTDMAGFYLPIVGCLRGKGTQISSHNKFPHVGPQNRSSRHFGHDLSAENGCFEWTRQNFQSTPQKDQTIHQNHNNN